MTDLCRRDFLSSALLLPAFARQTSTERFISVVSLGNPGGAPAPPFGRLLGAGLDARLFTDLSTLGQQSTIDNFQSTLESTIRNPQSAMLTAADKFFIRTAAPRDLPADGKWALDLSGLEPRASSAGRVLIECSGNADQSNYGLMSTADWDGIPVSAVVERMRPPSPRHRILIAGRDDPGPSRTSVPGASWIFSPDDLQRALFATRMNGAPLTRDHGFPVRLIVPGWYGCSCIKWVDRIELLPDDAPATTQMREFAARTHQPSGLLREGQPAQAREFIPAAIDTAAMPVRVEKWLVNRRLEHRITGIIWGGSKPTNALSIRFKTNEPWLPVDDCPLPASTLTWSLWTHTWRPAAPGRYQIVLRVNDPAIRTRRLDIFFYVREIQIDDV
jgi:hypothetical protein